MDTVNLNQETDVEIQKALAKTYLENLFNTKLDQYSRDYGSGKMREEDLDAEATMLTRIDTDKKKLEQGDHPTIDKYFQLEIARQKEENERKARENNK